MERLRPAVTPDSPPKHIARATHSRVSSSSLTAADPQDADFSDALRALRQDRQDLAEKVFSDNAKLRRRFTELEETREETETSYQLSLAQIKKAYEDKLAEIEHSLAEKDDTIKGLKARMARLQASLTSSVVLEPQTVNRVEKLLGKIGHKLEALTLVSRENFGFMREQLDLIDRAESKDYEPSSIQTESVVRPAKASDYYKKTHRKATIDLIPLESSLKSTLPCLKLDESTDLYKEVKRQRAQIKEHEAFINQFKGTLEALLEDRPNSEAQSPEWRHNLMKLRSVLQ
jgi:cyanate lyase